MQFVGVISDTKSFEIIKSIVLKNINEKKLNIININLQSIENIKNIKFETIIVNNNLEKFSSKEELLKKICTGAKYLVLNSDIEIKLDILQEQKLNIITYRIKSKSNSYSI